MNFDSKNLSEGNIPIGTWNKYKSKNPFQVLLVKRFFKEIENIISNIKNEIKTSLDVGCGEGHITNLLFESGLTNVRGCDFSEMILSIARSEYPELIFYKRNIYDIDKSDSSDLVTACEVLEHLDEPNVAVKRLAMITNNYCIISVPEEPLFRTLNFLAGKYWKDYGNSPGHINHWSKKTLFELLERHFDIIKFKRSIPWLIILAKPKFKHNLP